MVITFKEKCRVYYMVKGDLRKVTPQTIEGSYNSYFRRLWVAGSNGAPLANYEVGFEENYEQYCEIRVLL